MKIFDTALNTYAADFRQHEYVLAKGIVSKDFIRFASAQLAKCRSSGYNELPAREIKSKKKQYLFDLPAGDDVLRELVHAVSEVTGTPAERMTVSERHIMIYDDNAETLPPLHKDRLASRFSIGIPLEYAPDGRIALLPNGPRDLNLLDKAVYCPRPSLDERRNQFHLAEQQDRQPRDLLSCIELDAQPGDVVIFAGSSIFHGRSNAARSSILYFKISDLRLDPLGENPATATRRITSLAILRRVSDEFLLDARLELSPRLQNVSRVHTRSNWAMVLRASVSGENDFTISDRELDLLFRVHGGQRVREILKISATQAPQSCSDLVNIRRLVQLGALDLLE